MYKVGDLVRVTKDNNPRWAGDILEVVELAEIVSKHQYYLGIRLEDKLKHLVGEAEKFLFIERDVEEIIE